MTDNDLMPFGKHKGLPMSAVPKAYGQWLCAQEGFKDKSPGLYEYFTKGPTKPTNAEQDLIIEEASLLGGATPEFKAWWKAAYGDRLKSSGPHLYIPHLRVALSAFNAGWGVAAHNYEEKLSAAKPPVVKPENIHRPKNPDPVKNPEMFADDVAF